MRPGTQQRLGTGSGRLPTGGASGASGLMGPAANVLISARPVTQQGLGMRGSTAGPGRQVQDASFFAGLLRSKTGEIMAEMAKMRADTDRALRDSSLTVQLERRFDGAIKEVRALEGELADYNLAMDKARTNVEASEISAFLASVKRRNEAMAKEVSRGARAQPAPAECA